MRDLRYDTYAIAASEETSRDLGVQTISDLKRLVEDRPADATLCVNNDDDFLTRFDGLPGMEQAYGFEFPEDNLIETSVEAVYDATAEAEICNFGVVFTTSGFIRDLDLRSPGRRQGLLRRIQPGAHRKAGGIQAVSAATQGLRPHLREARYGDAAQAELRGGRARQVSRTRRQNLAQE